MKRYIFLLPFLVLIGCDPIARLTGGQITAPPPNTHIAVPERYEGDFRHSNFVEIDLEKVKDVSIFIKREGTWISIEGYTTSQKTKDTYYVIVKNMIVFLNIVPSDLYSIEVTR